MSITVTYLALHLKLVSAVVPQAHQPGPSLQEMEMMMVIPSEEGLKEQILEDSKCAKNKDKKINEDEIECIKKWLKDKKQLGDNDQKNGWSRKKILEWLKKYLKETDYYPRWELEILDGTDVGIWPARHHVPGLMELYDCNPKDGIISEQELDNLLFGKTCGS